MSDNVLLLARSSDQLCVFQIKSLVISWGWRRSFLWRTCSVVVISGYKPRVGRDQIKWLGPSSCGFLHRVHKSDYECWKWWFYHVWEWVGLSFVALQINPISWLQSLRSFRRYFHQPLILSPLQWSYLKAPMSRKCEAHFTARSSWSTQTGWPEQIRLNWGRC